MYESILKIRDKTSLLRVELARSSTPSPFTEGRALSQFLDNLEDELTRNLDAMEALNQCARHQNRITEDVLQLGKLCMNLASLKEMPFDPIIEIKSCIRTFEREALVKKIELKLSVGNMYKSLQVGWVSGDPVRFAQVLLNLLSNAVRFTENARTRTIEITVDASVEEPDLSSPLVLNHSSETRKPLSEDLSSSNTDSLFLISTVIDSGIGLTEEEQKKLFQKLNQSSPKTHIKYGGNGLGLFISKTLVEAQSGSLTLESVKHKGTKVAFYICVKTADPPAKTLTRALAKSFGLRTTLMPERDPSVLASKELNVLVVEDNLVRLRIIRF